MLTNRQSGVLQYGDLDNVIQVFEQRVGATETGVLLVRAHFSGSVAKRIGGTGCLVTVGVRRDQEAVPFISENVGIVDGPAAERLEVSVGGTLAGQVPIDAGQSALLRFEIQRADPDCAPPGAGGPEQIAQIFGQLDVSFFQFTLPTQ